MSHASGSKRPRRLPSRRGGDSRRGVQAGERVASLGAGGKTLVVSGTGTEIGKTIVTAALAALCAERGERVAVVKLAQTGIATGEPTDVDTVRRLSGVTDVHELSRFPDPLSPEAAARTARLPPLDMKAAASYIGDLAAEREHVIVEGAGGLLVRYDPDGTTIADLASMVGAPVLVVTTAGLGTLNQTALTLEALATRALATAGVVIGSWPARPGLAELSNLIDLADVLTGTMPEGAGELSRAEFLAAARSLTRKPVTPEYAPHGVRPASVPSLPPG